MELTDAINQMGLADIYRIFSPNANEHTFFSISHRTFPKIDHILSHKEIFNINIKIQEN
jgi:exonuclease III